MKSLIKNVNAAVLYKKKTKKNHLVLIMRLPTFLEKITGWFETQKND